MPRSLQLFAVAALALAACGGTKPQADDDFGAFAGVDEKSDAFSTRMRIVGSLDYGQTSDPVFYDDTPRYRAFKFAGAKGDAVDIWVRSTTGNDAVGWLLDNSFKIISVNDDANRYTLDSHITARLPANKNPGIVTYYVVFRDYNLGKGDFTVSLAKTNCVQSQVCAQGSAWDAKACKCVATGCDYDGKHYAEGASFPASDGCNHCSCSAGRVGCTKIGCPPGCWYDGSFYAYGSSFPSSDGCNTCSCSTSGVACTERACLQDCSTQGCPSGQNCQVCKTINGPANFCLPNGSVC